LFLILSGIATGGAWLCEYAALNYLGSNPIVVNSIGKLSILLTMFFSFIILKEKFNKKSLLGLILLTLGIIIIIIFSL
jgi:transporter family protein